MQRWIRNWRLAAIFIVASLFFLVGDVSTAEASTADSVSAISMLGQISKPEVARGPGGYFSWIKLALIAVVFIFWVVLSDKLNQDALRFGDLLQFTPEVWNTINVFGFLIGFFTAISVPIFWVGYPIYAIIALLPPMLYFMQRRSKLKQNPNLKESIQRGVSAIKSGEAATANVQIHSEPLPQDEGAEVEFKPAGDNSNDRQKNLIRARQSIGYPVLKDMVADVATRRGEVVMLDYTRDAAACRMQVDGTWHQLPTLDRETGDALLMSAKCLAGLNPADRRSRQQGQFEYQFDKLKGSLEITSQGIQTGERVLIKFLQKKKEELNLGQLGMWPDMFKSLVGHLNEPGLIIVSAPPQGGLSTSWRATLMAADRVTRDYVSFVVAGDKEQDFENITRYEFPAGGAPVDVMRSALMAQPDGIVVPNVINSATLDEMTRQVIEEKRTVITHLQSKSAAEALLRLYAIAGDKARFAQAVTAVTCQKLARRLCEKCKQQVQVNPQLIQQLGGDPQKQNWLHNHFTGPRPDQVDEKGNPIEIPPCTVCSAFGYIGRIAIFELIENNDQLRQVLTQQPKLPVVANAAQKLGNATMAQQAYRLVLVGLTSLAEVQHVMKS